MTVDAARSTVIVRGLAIELHQEGEGIADHIRLAEDFYEAPILERIRQDYPVQRVIVDAGANIGNHSLYWAAFQSPEAIHAFEPLEENCRLFERNLAAYPNVQLHRIALSDRAGALRMKPIMGNLGISAVAEGGPVEVQAAALDSFVLERVTLIKVDVEGWEDRVLIGARETIARCHPLVLVEDWDDSCAALLPGYKCVGEWPGANYLYEWAER